MSEPCLFWSVVLVVLAAWLCAMEWRGHRCARRAEEERLRAIQREFPARGFDVSAIAPRIRRVRQDYATAAQQRRRPVYYRAELFAVARRVVTSCAYFRRAKPGNEWHDPAQV